MPFHTTRPRSIRKCRSATRKSAPTFLSITRIDRPDSFRLARQRQISARISGARPFGRLVEDQQARIGHQRAADRQHLLLAAGKLIAHAVIAFGQPGEQVIDLGERPICAVAFDRRRQQIFAHGKVRKNLPAFRHQTDTALGDLV